MALTGKKKAFADAVLARFSNKEAAIKAGYSKTTASAAGSRLVKDKAVAEYIEKHKAGEESGEEVTDECPKFSLEAAMQHSDPKMFLLAAMNDIALDPKQRIIAARALVPLFHGKVADQGKKESKKESAAEVSSLFGLRKPRLVSAQ